MFTQNNSSTMWSFCSKMRSFCSKMRSFCSKCSKCSQKMQDIRVPLIVSSSKGYGTDEMRGFFRIEDHEQQFWSTAPGRGTVDIAPGVELHVVEECQYYIVWKGQEDDTPKLYEGGDYAPFEHASIENSPFKIVKFRTGFDIRIPNNYVVKTGGYLDIVVFFGMGKSDDVRHFTVNINGLTGRQTVRSKRDRSKRDRRSR